MALSDYDAPKASIASIQRRLNETVEGIRANRSFTPQGRKVEMAKAVLTARNQTEKLKAEFVAAREARRTNLERIVFGIVGEPTASDLIAHRDAQDRAASLTGSDEAAAVLRRANQSNDESLAKAVAQAAFQRGWTEVANNYADMWDKRACLDMLTDTHAGPNTVTADAVTFRIRAPEELGPLPGDSDLENLANMDVVA
jgi:hypothetical protein